MALIYCRYCGGRVSDKASACPHCGAMLEREQPQMPKPATWQESPNTTHKKEKRQQGGSTVLRVVGFMVLAVIFAFVLFMVHDATSADTSPSNASAITESENTRSNSGATSECNKTSESAARESGTNDIADDSSNPVGHYFLKGKVDGRYNMSLALDVDDDGNASGTYRNIDYGTTMKVEGKLEGHSLNVVGYLDGVEYRFVLRASADRTTYSGNWEINSPTETKVKSVSLVRVSD